MRLVNLDFEERFRDLLTSARQANVAFYPISPAGLQGMPFSERGGIDLDAYHAQMRRADSLRSLASETDGIAVINTNNLAGGMRSIADDLHAYYVLGYYTSNTTWDGKVRSIKVRLKPKQRHHPRQAAVPGAHAGGDRGAVGGRVTGPAGSAIGGGQRPGGTLERATVGGVLVCTRPLPAGISRSSSRCPAARTAPGGGPRALTFRPSRKPRTVRRSAAEERSSARMSTASSCTCRSMGAARPARRSSASVPKA